MSAVGPAVAGRDLIIGAGVPDRIRDVARVADCRGHAVAGQGVGHGGGFARHEPVGAAHPVVTYGWKDVLRTSNPAAPRAGVESWVTRHGLAQDRLDRVAGAPSLPHRLGEQHETDARPLRRNREVPDPTEIGVTVVDEERRAVVQWRRVEVGPQADLPPAVSVRGSAPRAPAAGCAAGVDVPTGVDAAAGGGRACRNPVSLRLDLRTRSQRNVVPSACARSKSLASRAVRSTCSVTVSKRSGLRRICGGGDAVHSFAAQLAHDNLLLVGGDLVGQRAIGPDAEPLQQPGLDQSSDSPTLLCGQGSASRQTTLRPSFRSSTQLARPARPAPITATS